MKGKSKTIKVILIIFLIALIGAGAYAIASQKWKKGDTKNNETIQDKEDNEIENKEAENEEIDNEENIEEQEAPIDNYVEKLNKINCKGVAKEKGDFAINGIKLGMTKEEVEKLIGSPKKFNDDKYDSSLVSAIYGEDENKSPVIQYNKECGNYTVYSVIVGSESEKFKTDRGLKVGDTFEKLISKYAKEEKVEPYEKSPNVYVLYGAEDIGMNEDEGVMYPKSEQSQYATMYGFYDSGLEDVGLIVSYNYGDNCIDYLVKNGVIETITLMPMIY